MYVLVPVCPRSLYVCPHPYMSLSLCVSPIPIFSSNYIMYQSICIPVCLLPLSLYFPSRYKLCPSLYMSPSEYVPNLYNGVSSPCMSQPLYIPVPIYILGDYMSPVPVCPSPICLWSLYVPSQLMFQYPAVASCGRRNQNPFC